MKERCDYLTLDYLGWFCIAKYEGVDFTSKSLEVIIPDVELSFEQVQATIDSGVYAKSLGIDVKIVVAR